MPMTAPAKRKNDEAPPDVERHDEVYFRHAAGPRVGKVLSRGKHGCVIDADGERHKVKWEHLLGHKTRVRPDVRVVDQGEDGMLVEDPAGRRRYVHDPIDDGADREMAKSRGPIVLLVGADHETLAKSLKDRPGLSLQDRTDKNGKQTKRWVRTTKDQPKARRKGAEAGAGEGYGTHNLQAGSHVNFKAGDFEGSGVIVGEPGADGAHVKDQSGRQHQVHWHEITGHKPGEGAKPKEERKPKVLGSQGSVSPTTFAASSYAASHDDASVTPEDILKDFPPDTADKIKATQDRLAGIEETIKSQKQDGEYVRARQAIHRKIFGEMLSPERIAAATPADGQVPTFTMLGGRGGSGKGWFKGKVYDPGNAIVLDADEIKGQLPEYEGWNAAQVHEESSEILESILGTARAMGLNVVLDATMKSSKGALAKVESFKQAGYRVEAHYMHLPRQEAARRAVDRFLGETQRYVPIDIVLGNTSNEATFDEVRKHADAWSFRDNNVERGQDPILISEKTA